jgi:hypothetical protein
VARLGRLEATVREQARETREARADARALERRVAELEAERTGERDAASGVSWQSEHEGEAKGGTFRRAQAASQDNTTVVHLHRASVVSVGGPGMGTSPNNNGGHRRAQTAGVCGNLAARINAINVECCNEPSEDCSSGAPATCNTGCAGVFLPFWADCGAQLPSSASFLPVVARCQAVAPGGGSAGGTGAGSGSLVHEFNLVCAGGAVDTCVPACSAALRGDLLLMNLNGEDSKYHLHVPLNHDQKSGLTEECLCRAMPILILLTWSRYSCELHHGLHSWVGAATDGGYLGSDAQAFVSAVLSAAAGYYALAMVGDGGFSLNLNIQFGQSVHISGDSALSTVPSWGNGGFIVNAGTHLSLSALLISGASVVLGRIQLNGCVLSINSGRGILIQDGGIANIVSSNFHNIHDGALEIRNGNVSISNSQFTANGNTNQNFSGGAILVFAGARVTIAGSSFTNNVVYGHDFWGGAIEVDYCAPGQSGHAVPTIAGATISISGSQFSGNGGDGQDDAIWAKDAQIPNGHREVHDSHLTNAAATAYQPLQFTGYPC